MSVLLHGSGSRARQVAHEGIGVRVNQDAACLPPDDALNQTRKIGIAGNKRQIRPHLRGRIAQPHGRDVSSHHHRVRSAVKFPRSHRGVERIRQAVRKQPRQLRIGDLARNRLDGGIDGTAAKLSRRRLRPLRGIWNGFGCEPPNCAWGERSGCGESKSAKSLPPGEGFERCHLRPDYSRPRS